MYTRYSIGIVYDVGSINSYVGTSITYLYLKKISLLSQFH